MERAGYMEENWLVYVNGAMLPMDESKISVFDRGFQYGDGVFEGLRAYEGRIFKLREHTDRLFRSAKAVNINIPLTKDEFSDAVIKRQNSNIGGQVRHTSIVNPRRRRAAGDSHRSHQNVYCNCHLRSAAFSALSV